MAKSLLCVFIAFLVLPALAFPVGAQFFPSKNGVPQETVNFCLFWMDYQGQLICGRMMHPQPALPREFRFLRSARVREEMELSDQQKVQLDSLLDELERRLNPPYVPGKSPRSGEAKVSLDSEAPAYEVDEAFVRSVQDRMNSILLPHQQRRIGELAVRYHLRMNGVVSELTLQGPRRRVVELSDQQRDLLLNQGIKVSSRIRDESIALKKDAYNRLLDVFEDARRDEVREKLESSILFSPADSSFGVFILHLAPETAKLESTPDEDLEKHAKWQSSLHLVFDDDGAMIRPSFMNPGSEDTVRACVTQNLLHFLKEEFVIRALAITDDQLVQLSKLDRTWEESVREISDELRTKTEREPARQMEFQSDYWDRMDEVQRPVFDQIHVILLPHQREELLRLRSRIHNGCVGMVAALLYGDPGRELDITDSERDRLRKKAAELRKEMMAKSLEIEAGVYDELFSVLDEGTREKVQAIIGDPIKSGFADLDLLAQQLAVGKKR